MGIENPFKGPGDKDLNKWAAPGMPGREDKKPPSDSLTTKAGGGGGGGGKAAKEVREAREAANKAQQPQEEPPEQLDMSGSSRDEAKKEPVAKLSEPAWVAPDTCFREEAEVSVKLTLPPGKEHLTRVEVELIAKTPKGEESISKGEGHAKADGKANVIVPVYTPKTHDGGPVEYFFKVTHKLATLLSAETIVRKISETALKSSDHILIPGIAFPNGSSFIHPRATAGLKEVESKLKEWDKKDPKKAKIAVFGHADKNEKDPKALSERRAKSAYAFITNDASAWDELYLTEKWGLKRLQILLNDLDLYHDAEDGDYGTNTKKAFEAIQKKAGLEPNGKEDSATRKAIFAAFMKGKHDIKIEASRFRSVAGHPWMGCATNNGVRDSDKPVPENRRVTFVLLKESVFFPIHFPCKDGSESGCQGQCKRPGKRSTPGVKCLFYDELVREKKQDPSEDDPSDTDLLTEEELKAMTGASDDLIHRYLPHLNREMKAKEVISPLRKAHFFAQVCQESANLKYSLEQATGDAYEGRKDLGNTEAGDGPKFKGRGLIQLTGRYNYTEFGKFCGEDLTSGTNYKKLEEPKFAVLSAFWFWTTAHLNNKSDDSAFLDVCYGVNRGFNHVDRRAVYLKKALDVFKVPDPKDHLKKILPPLKANLDKVLPLVEAHIKENPGHDHEKAAHALAKAKTISRYEWLLYLEMDTEAKISSLKTKLGL